MKFDNLIRDTYYKGLNWDKVDNFHISYIMFKNKVIAWGKNDIRTHTVNLLNPKIDKRGNDISDEKGCCSEFSSIRKLKRLTGIDSHRCVLINIRLDKNMKLAYARPCNSCRSLINYHRFKQVWYTTGKGRDFALYEN